MILQPKDDGKLLFSADFRKVNALSRSDMYLLPGVDDSVDKIRAAAYITKVDLMKGYWQYRLLCGARRGLS